MPQASFNAKQLSMQNPLYFQSTKLPSSILFPHWLFLPSQSYLHFQVPKKVRDFLELPSNIWSFIPWRTMHIRWKRSISLMSILVATSHNCLLRTWNVPSESEELDFKFKYINSPCVVNGSLAAGLCHSSGQSTSVSPDQRLPSPMLNLRTCLRPAEVEFQTSCPGESSVL